MFDPKTGTGWPEVLEDDDGIRPVSGPDICHYCRAKVGQAHARNCVCVEKLVRVRYTVEIDIRVPHHWTEHDVNFHRNDSSWCADSCAADIEAHVNRNDGVKCLCNDFTAEFVRVVDETPVRSDHDEREREDAEGEEGNGD